MMQLSAAAKRVQFGADAFGALDLHDRPRCAPASTASSRIADLLFDAAVEFAVVLMAAAGGQNDALRMFVRGKCGWLLTPCSGSGR